ncbi:MAG: hypothetical protein OXK73_04860, partial [Rhodospirillaceae bacterium]|nr:hypothetical protein [Rhodospirillaceae bacterium]
MSEAKSSKKASKPKTESAPKAESKSESKGADTKAKDDAGSTSSESVSTEAKSSDGAKETSKDGGKGAGKSARDSAGGKADVHYGYFSSVRTPAYRSGWDEIWGSTNGDDAGNGEETPRQRRAAARASRSAKKVRKRRDPITVTLDLDTLPPALKDGLVEIASAELKKSRVSYARRDKAGAIDWRITC